MYIRLFLGLLILVISSACTNTTTSGQPPSSVTPASTSLNKVSLEPTPINIEVPGTTVDGGQNRGCQNQTPEDVVELDIAAGRSVNGSGYFEKKFRDGLIVLDVTRGQDDTPDLATITFKGNLHPKALIVNNAKGTSLEGVSPNVEITISGDTFGTKNRIWGATVCF